VNLDFSEQPIFSWYVVLLFISGVAMLVLGAINSGGLSRGWRVANLLFGLGFVGYAFYLAFLFQGGHYIIFFKAFILPVVVIFNFFRGLGTRRGAQPAQIQQAAAAQWAQQAAAQQVPGAAPYAPPAPANPYGQAVQANPYAQPPQPVPQAAPSAE
jgi:hypothetical protein